VLHQVRPEWVEGGAVPRPPARGVPAASATPPPTPSGPTHQSGEERTLLEVRVKDKEYYREKDNHESSNKKTQTLRHFVFSDHPSPPPPYRVRTIN
jgi:hypothetical protein